MITHLCLSCCWTVWAQHPGFTCLPLRSPQRWGWACARSVEGTQPGQLTPAEHRDIPYHMALWAAEKVVCFFFWYVIIAWRLDGHQSYLWEVVSHGFCITFLFSSFVLLFLCLLNSFYFSHKCFVWFYFLPFLILLIGEREGAIVWGSAASQGQPQGGTERVQVACCKLLLVILVSGQDVSSSSFPAMFAYCCLKTSLEWSIWCGGSEHQF